MAGSRPSHEVERWMLIADPDSDAWMIVLVVDDAHDDELAAIVARENMVPAEHFSGLWGTGERDGYWLVGFRLIELGGGIEREFFTDNIHRELLEAILDVPHLVAILPRELAGDANTGEDLAPRLGGALIVECEHHSPQVERVLAERDD